MPKRTNDFQKLITKIYQQMAAPDVRVTESAILNEPGKGTSREIDILIEQKISDIPMRIAIECRGRKDKDDIDWIDGLIGKYRDLHIEKVVAVSKSGFTAGAQAKAQANNIHILTLVKALETNWPQEFVQLGISALFRHDRVNQLQVTTDGDFPNKWLEISVPLYGENGEQIGTLEEVSRSLYEQSKETILNEIVNQLFKSPEDFQKHDLVAQISFEPLNSTYIGDATGYFRVNQIILDVMCSFSVEPQQTSHYLLGSRQITLAKVSSDYGRINTIVTAIQEANNPFQVNILVEKSVNPFSVELEQKQARKRKAR